MVWNEAWPCCMIYRDEITYFIGEREIYLLESQWLCQGQCCQGIRQSTLVDFSSTKIKQQKKGQIWWEIIINKLRTRLDLGIAERCASWQLSPPNQRQKSPKGKQVHALYVIYMTFTIKMPYIICLDDDTVRIYCISESDVWETTAALQEKSQSILQKSACYFLTRTDPVLCPTSSQFNIQRHSDFCCMHLTVLFF